MAKKVVPISPVRIPETDIHYAPGMKAGNWVFLTGIEAVDYGVGLHPAVAGNPELPYHGLPKHRREGDFVCARFRNLLAEAGRLGITADDLRAAWARELEGAA